MRRVFLALVTVLVLTTRFTAPTTAGPANDAVASCVERRDGGNLDTLGTTFGDCVNEEKGPVSANAGNWLAAYCAQSGAQAIAGAANQGQCITYFSASAP